MEIQEQQFERGVAVRISGRLDTTNYTDLEKKLNDLIDRQQDRILVDCSGMDYISSSGLRILLMALKKVNLAKGIFALCGLQPGIREIFDISGFTTIFAIFDTQEDAIKTF
jgi:anti-sigma B factor antagonist